MNSMRLLIILINTLLTLADKCTIRPYEAKGPKQSGNNGYTIEVDAATTRSDNGSSGFIPGETYKKLSKFRYFVSNCYLVIASVVALVAVAVVGVAGIGVANPLQFCCHSTYYLMLSPNSPQEPRVPIKWITTKDDPLSPFYSTETDVIPPLAKLILRRKEVAVDYMIIDPTSVIPMRCFSDDEYRTEAFNVTNTSEDEEYKDRSKITELIRRRYYVYNYRRAQMFNCHRQTTERQFCNAKINECEGKSNPSSPVSTQESSRWLRLYF
ncbi:hypothetical protein OESDEN_14100 [Oesophagostomum dentatum]|uniref:Uncharacterized protein n=1 Tax=Oesophagostomum dentatum TaxID=61180 RepID=A0A0B1SLJ4_OESDE|nr:hypothetical protein OESDEN_14100 [Oesophagostomum dentatum]